MTNLLLLLSSDIRFGLLRFGIVSLFLACTFYIAVSGLLPGPRRGGLLGGKLSKKEAQGLFFRQAANE